MKKILPETWILGIIATLDCLSTIYLLHAGMAKEANPMLACALTHGYLAFFIVKMFFVIAPLACLEQITQHSKSADTKKFILWAMRIGIVVYVTGYTISTILQLVLGKSFN